MKINKKGKCIFLEFVNSGIITTDRQHGPAKMGVIL